MSKITDIQTILGVPADDNWGPVSQAALDGITGAADIHRVFASSFADSADVARFRRCKELGGTDQQCFKVGDNGIGKWGDDCTAAKAMCALPPEDWGSFGEAARGKEVEVTANGVTIVCELRDTMPHRANITNGCGIDLNPEAVALLELRPPIRVPATWRWVAAALLLFAFSGCSSLYLSGISVGATQDEAGADSEQVSFHFAPLPNPKGLKK